MVSTHGEEQWQKMFEMSILKLDGGSRMMHLNFWRRWNISLIICRLHAKGQTLNIYPVNSAPNRLGVHSGLAHLGPVFQNGVRPGVSLNLTKSATKPKIAFFKMA